MAERREERLGVERAGVEVRSGVAVVAVVVRAGMAVVAVRAGVVVTMRVGVAGKLGGVRGPSRWSAGTLGIVVAARPGF